MVPCIGCKREFDPNLKVCPWCGEPIKVRDSVPSPPLTRSSPVPVILMILFTLAAVAFAIFFVVSKRKALEQQLGTMDVPEVNRVGTFGEPVRLRLPPSQ